MPTVSRAARRRRTRSARVGDLVEHVGAERRACRGRPMVGGRAGHRAGPRPRRAPAAPSPPGRAAAGRAASALPRPRPSGRTASAVPARRDHERRVLGEGDMLAASVKTASVLVRVRRHRTARIPKRVTRDVRGRTDAGQADRRATRAWSRGAPRARRRAISRSELAEQPVALGHDVVLVDRLEVLLAGRDEGVRRRGRRTRSIAMRTISRTQSSTKRGRRCAFSTTSTSSGRFISS